MIKVQVYTEDNQYKGAITLPEFPIIGDGIFNYDQSVMYLVVRRLYTNLQSVDKSEYYGKIIVRESKIKHGD